MIVKPGVFHFIFALLLFYVNSYAAEAKLVAGDGESKHHFGTSVEIDSNLIFIGAPGSLSDGDYRGAVYVYVIDPNTKQWLKRQKLIMDDDGPYDLFGSSIAKSDSFLIVGARGDSLGNPFGGAAFIFKLNSDNSWVFFQKLITTQLVPMDKFGYAVDIQGNVAAVGAPRAGGRLPQSGAVYIYRLIDDEWILDAKLVASPGTMNDYFGASVALSGQELIVGASGLDVNVNYSRQITAGSAYIFKRIQSGWNQTAYLSPADGNLGNLFGCAVALEGNYAVVGSRKDDVLDFDDGSVYIYKRNNNAWAQEIKLTPLDADSGDYFGTSVGLYQDYLVIGAPGVNGGGRNTGAVYSYLRTEEGWTQRGKKSAYDAEKFDNFGFAVSVSKNMSVVGAPNKKVNGKLGQGAAYVYDNITDLALPVELSSFTATPTAYGVLLQWMTQSEKDNLGFILQRKTDGQEWNIIASFQTQDELRGQGSTSMPTLYEFFDDGVELNQTYSYRLADVTFNGEMTFHEPIQVSVSSAVKVESPALPVKFELYPAFPNPFNPQTTLRYDLPHAVDVMIDVFDAAGRHVKTLENEYQTAGSFSTIWDGRDENGTKMSSGVYFIQIRVGDVTRSQKVILLQ